MTMTMTMSHLDHFHDNQRASRALRRPASANGGSRSAQDIRGLEPVTARCCSCRLGARVTVLFRKWPLVPPGQRIRESGAPEEASRCARPPDYLSFISPGRFFSGLGTAGRLEMHSHTAVMMAVPRISTATDQMHCM